jgi:predicted ATPase
VGPGGIGKTRLALAAAQHQADRRQEINQSDFPFGDGIYFVSLAPLSQSDHIVPTIAGILNFPLQKQDKRPPQQQLVEYLRRKRMLLILDNFEHLLDGTGLVT